MDSCFSTGPSKERRMYIAATRCRPLLVGVISASSMRTGALAVMHRYSTAIDAGTIHYVDGFRLSNEPPGMCISCWHDGGETPITAGVTPRVARECSRPVSRAEAMYRGLKSSTAQNSRLCAYLLMRYCNDPVLSRGCAGPNNVRRAYTRS